MVFVVEGILDIGDDTVPVVVYAGAEIKYAALRHQEWKLETKLHSGSTIDIIDILILIYIFGAQKAIPVGAELHVVLCIRTYRPLRCFGQWLPRKVQLAIAGAGFRKIVPLCIEITQVKVQHELRYR